MVLTYAYANGSGLFTSYLSVADVVKLKFQSGSICAHARDIHVEL